MPNASELEGRRRTRVPGRTGAAGGRIDTGSFFWGGSCTILSVKLLGFSAFLLGALLFGNT